MTLNQIPVITIDGPSGSGKGTICQLLANELGFHLLDSGALYRLTAVAAIRQHIDLDNESLVAGIARTLDVSFEPGEEGGSVIVKLGDDNVTKEIRQESASMGSSKVAAHPQVRAALLERQRAFQKLPGLVADGRDMGTTVFPDAAVKIYLTASAEERAKRRYQQLIARGESASIRALLEDIQARDRRDMERSASPLMPANDALIIDSTTMSIDEVMSAVLEAVGLRLR